MSTDLDLLCAIRANQRPAARHRIAELLDIEDDTELAKSLARLTSEGLLDRVQLGESSFSYVLTGAGRARMLEATESGELVAKLRARDEGLTRRNRAGQHRRAPPHEKRTENETGSAVEGLMKMRDDVPPAPETTASPKAKPPKRNRPMPKALSMEEARNTTLAQLRKSKGKSASPAELATATGIAEPQLRRALKSLKKNGDVQTEGTGRGTKYAIAGETGSKRPKAGEVRRHLAAAVESITATEPIAAFNKSGEIVIVGPAGVKALTRSEAREVAELVCAFNQEGLLPKAA